MRQRKAREKKKERGARRRAGIVAPKPVRKKRVPAPEEPAAEPAEEAPAG
jgi:hypothetical protein